MQCTDNKEFLGVMVCPLCKGKLHYDKIAKELTCRFDKLVYSIVDGVPVMMADKARDWRKKDKEESGGTLN